MKTSSRAACTAALFAALIALGHSTATAALFSSGPKVVTNITHKGEFPADLKRLDVDNRLGALRIIGTDAAPFDWSWSLEVRARDAALGHATAAKATCIAVQNNDKLSLLVTLPDTDGKVNFQSDLELRVPKSVTVTTKNRYGKTTITDLTGDTEATGVSGALELQRLTGKVRAETSYATLRVRDTGPAMLKNKSGAIEAIAIRGPLDADTSYGTLTARDIAGDVKARNVSGAITLAKAVGSADLKTSYGAIKAQGVTGRATLHTVSGSITASDMAGPLEAHTAYGALDLETAGPDIECRNQSGATKLRATSPALTNLVVKTSYGSLEVSLPAALQPAINAQTSYGHLKSDFPLLPKSKSPFADVPAGTPRITLENKSGSIRIVRE